MRKFTGTFFVLALSRAVGLLREFLIAMAFGFSRFTDLFYQATWPLQAFITVTNGPFTTAFSARFARAPVETRMPHARYYRRLAWRLALGLAGVFLLAGLGLVLSGRIELGFVIAILSGAAFALTFIGLFYALATACGWVTQAAVLLFLTNISFVSGILLMWLLGIELEIWMLPLLFTLGMCAGLPICLLIWRRLEVNFGAQNSGTSEWALEGLGSAFISAGLETSFFLLTQGLIVILATHMGEGWVSGAALVQRVVFSVNGLIISPFASLLMLRIIQMPDTAARAFVRGQTLATLGLICVAVVTGVALPQVIPYLIEEYAFARVDTIRLVASILPAFSLWLVPMGLNVIVCRAMFGLDMHRHYTIVTIIGYLAANGFRIGFFQIGGFPTAIYAGAAIEMITILYLSNCVIQRIRAGQDK